MATLLMLVAALASTLFVGSARAFDDDPPSIQAFVDRGGRRIPAEELPSGSGADVTATDLDDADVRPPEILDAASIVREVLEPITDVAPLRELTQPIAERPGANNEAGVMSMLPPSVTDWLLANDWTVQWRTGPGPGRVAEAQYDTFTIVLWHSTDWPAEFWAGAVAHELGHAVSYMEFSDAQRQEWNAMRGLDSWWWVPGTPNDFWVGEGDFAEAFMHRLLGHPIRSAGGALTAAQAAWIDANTTF